MNSVLLVLMSALVVDGQVQELPSTDPTAGPEPVVEVSTEVSEPAPEPASAGQEAAVEQSPPNTSLSQNPVSDLVARVVEIQRAKCLDCHNPDSDKRKAKRKYPDALDLAATVEEWVVAGDPMDSDLYLMLEDGEMPPDDSDVPPLTEEELKVYHDWIASGASVELPATTPAESKGQETVEEQLPLPGPTDPERMRRFIGRQHPAVVHFPIGLILSAALLELMIMFRRREGWLHAQRFCLRFGALMAAVSAALGFMLTEFTMTSDELWLHGSLAGTALLLSLNAARCVPKDAEARRNRFRLWLGAAALFISATGFMGGYMVFGWDYLKY